MVLQSTKKMMGGRVGRPVKVLHVPALSYWVPGRGRKPRNHSLQRTGEKKEGKTRPGAGQAMIGLPQRGTKASPGTLER